MKSKWYNGNESETKVQMILILFGTSYHLYHSEADMPWFLCVTILPGTWINNTLSVR